MQIFYCEVCGLRISNDEVDAGSVVKVDDKIYCRNCATAKGIKASASKPARSTPDTIKKTPTSPLIEKVPSSTPARPSPNVSVVPKPRVVVIRQKDGIGAAGMMTAVGGVAVLFLGLIVFATRSKPEPAVAHNDDPPVAPRRDDPVKTPSPPVQPTQPEPKPTNPSPVPHILETPKFDPPKKDPATPVKIDKPNTPATTPQVTPATDPKNTSSATPQKITSEVISPNANMLLSVAFSADGKWLAFGSLDNAVRLMDMESRKIVKMDGHTQRVSSVAISPDGKYVGSGSWDHTAKIWDLQTQKCLHTLTLHTNNIWSVSFSADSSVFASAGFDKNVYLWNPVTGEGKKLDPKCSECLFMTFLPKDKLLLACGTGWHMNLFDAESGAARFQIMIKGVVHCGAGSPDANLFAANLEDGKQIGIWNSGGKLQGTLPGHSAGVGYLCFINEKLLASASADKQIRIWDVSSVKEVATLSGHGEGVSCIAYCPKRKMLASVSADWTLRFWNLESLLGSESAK